MKSLSKRQLIKMLEETNMSDDTEVVVDSNDFSNIEDIYVDDNSGKIALMLEGVCVKLNKRRFHIYYKDGVFAMSVTFTDKDDEFIKNELQNIIDNEFNTNINSLYHIDFSCIKEVKENELRKM